MELKRFLVVWVSLDPTVGAEIQKTRPCVILSPDEMNRHLHTVVVAPLTTVKRPLPTRVDARVGRKRGYICLDQIRTIDTSRITSPIAVLPPATQQRVRDVLRQAYVD